MSLCCGRFRRPTGWPGCGAQKFANDSANSRVIVRPYGDDGVRVTVAAPHENDAFLDFAQRWTKERV